METQFDEEGNKNRHGMTRRGFFKSMGVGAAAVAASGTVKTWNSAHGEVIEPHEMIKITLLINGRRRKLLVEPRWSLLYVLRERLGLTGTKVGCDRGECGACTVLMNGIPRYACLTLAMEAEGAEIITIEGLMMGESLGPVQEAFLEHDAFQCGYCTPGQIMTAEGLLRANSKPSIDEIRLGMSGNLCRCGAYTHIVKAVAQAAERKQRG
jgi:xanthine dehydrogenase YagT iron-sulfur-binding subunit